MLSSQERQEIRRLRKDDYELRRANEILKWASVFRQGARPRPTEASAFIDQHRERFAVEPVCRVRGVSASYYQRANGPRSERSIEDERLIGRIREVHAANYYAYGYRRMWKALLRAGETVSALPGPAAHARPWRTTRPPIPMRDDGPISVDSFETELISDRIWRTRSQFELAVVEYIGWFDHSRLHQGLGDVPPAEMEALYAPRTETNISLNIKTGSQLTRSA